MREGKVRVGNLPSNILYLVQAGDIDDAVSRLRAGAEHNFGRQLYYDVVLEDGTKLPPKAVFGLALEKYIGRLSQPSDFSAGHRHPCFKIIEAAGYPIEKRFALIQVEIDEVDEERVWAEGAEVRKQHLRRERAPGLANAKKRQFIEEHGKLKCERCEIVPSDIYGALGDACIEVHHAQVQVSNMSGGHKTRLSDLQCLCANCHRIVHREMKV